ncbi:MAG: N-acetylmuramoyl-L-alanine amidase [Pseudomonadota bacterium]
MRERTNFLVRAARLARAGLARLVLAWLVLASAWTGLSVAHGQSSGGGLDVEGVRIVGNGDPSRLTVWMTDAADTAIFIRQTGTSAQLVIDLGLTDSRSGALAPLNAAAGLAGYRWSGGQLVFDMARPMMVSRKLDLPPAGSEARHRLVVDLATVSDARFEMAARRDERRLDRLARLRAVAAADAAEAARQVRDARRHVVVIDAGHGGRDPGATSVRGDHEKSIVLKAALELKALLDNDPRLDVRLTRDDDTFIPLEQRVTLARDWGADLFISIHADAARKPDIAGASVYTLAQRAEGRVDREAARNDWHLPIEDGTSEEVSGILEDLVKRETKTNSGLFASMLIPQLQKAGPVLRDTHRSAGFYVLLAPDVPAVLVEIGFLTNRADAKRLASDRGRRKAVQALSASIVQYFDHQDAKLAVN